MGKEKVYLADNLLYYNDMIGLQAENSTKKFQQTNQNSGIGKYVY